jgi:hypothetical protein
MNWVRCILPLLLVLSLALGTTVQAVWMETMMSSHMAATTMTYGDMPGCDDCAPDQNTGKAMKMTGGLGGICIVLPGLLPTSLVGIIMAPDIFTVTMPTDGNGLSPPPDHRPPISISLA